MVLGVKFLLILSVYYYLLYLKAHYASQIKVIFRGFDQYLNVVGVGLLELSASRLQRWLSPTLPSLAQAQHRSGSFSTPDRDSKHTLSELDVGFQTGK